MSSNRFKIVFPSSSYSSNANIRYQVLSTIPSTSVAPTIRTNATLSLRSPMVARVHKVKPGCSSCGKKAF